MAIQKPTNPVEAMQAGVEMGLKIGNTMRAAIKERNDRIQYEEVYERISKNLAAVDSEIETAAKNMEDVAEQMRLEEFVSSKKMFQTFMQGTWGQVNRMKKKQMILSEAILEHPDNELITSAFGGMVASLMEEQKTASNNMEGALQTYATLAGTDIQAYRAKNDAAAQAAEAEEARKRTEIMDYEARTGRMGVQADINIRGARLSLDEYIAKNDIGLRNEELAWRKHYQGQDLSLRQKQVARMDKGQALEQMTMLAELTKENLTRHGQAGLVELSKLLSKEGVNYTPEDLMSFVDENVIYGKEIGAERTLAQQRVTAAQNAVAANPEDKGAKEVLKAEQLILTHLEEVYRAQQRARAEAIKIETLDGLGHATFKFAQEFAGATEVLHDIAYSLSPIGFVKNVAIPAARGVEAARPTGKTEAARRAVEAQE
jgi:hypothetical protein